MNYHIKDISLADVGKSRIEWALRDMKVLTQIRERFKEEKPLKGVRISACLHVTTETANLVMTLKEGGAEVFLCASNPLSTQDDVAASLVRDYGVSVFAVRGEDRDTYYSHILECLKVKPHIIMDDGADLTSIYHFIKHGFYDKLPSSVKKYLSDDSARDTLFEGSDVIGGTEETTTGVIRLRSMEKDGILLYPVIAVNDAYTKHLFDNRYGTGQSTVDGILRATNKLIAGSVFVVCGYGWCGRGVAMRARGMGARVIVCEVDPIRALEAVMDGFEVMPLIRASEIGDIFVTVTGNKAVIRKEHMERMKDGAILANSGHFDVEIDKSALNELAYSKRVIRDYVEEYLLRDGRRLYLLGEGRLINLVAAEGHPPSVMDMSFANQALSVEYLVKNAHSLEKKVYRVPEEIDRRVASIKLTTMGITIDDLTEDQKIYLSSWEVGT